MFPFLNLHFIKLPMYGVCIFTGVAIALVWAYIAIKKTNANWWDFVICATMSFALSILFAKLLYVAVSFPPSEYGKIIVELIKGNSSAAGGFVFYGGLIGGIAGLFLGSLIAKCSPFAFFDIAAVMLPFVQCFGRLGCTCAGCCYGIPYEGPLALHYTNALSSVPSGIGCFPVQLLEAFLMLLLSVVLAILFIKGKKHLIIIYLYTYGVTRFFLEYLRNDTERGFIGFLSTSQLISLLIVISATLTLVIRNQKENRS